MSCAALSQSRVLPQPDSPLDSRLICGNVVDELPKLSTAHQFDVIIADPPYNIGKDFGGKSDNMELNDYVEWTQSWLDQCFGLLADNGIIYVYGLPEILAHIGVKYPIETQRWLVWHYTNKNIPGGKFWQRSHESILCLWKHEQKRPTLEIDQIREPYTQGFMANVGRVRATTPGRFTGNRNGKETIYQAHQGGALPRDVIKIPALAGGAGACERWFLCRDCGHNIFPPKERKAHIGHDILIHPTQKPMALTRRLIQSRINGNAGRTLIPFAGSGSECAVAQELGVGWLGIEINREYVRFAQKWLQRIK